MKPPGVARAPDAPNIKLSCSSFLQILLSTEFIYVTTLIVDQLRKVSLALFVPFRSMCACGRTCARVQTIYCRANHRTWTPPALGCSRCRCRDTPISHWRFVAHMSVFVCFFILLADVCVRRSFVPERRKTISRRALSLEYSIEYRAFA